MPNLKTHFEQVPLEMIKKVIEEEVSRGNITEVSRAVEKKHLQETPLGGKRSRRVKSKIVSSSFTISQVKTSEGGDAVTGLDRKAIRGGNKQ